MNINYFLNVAISLLSTYFIISLLPKELLINEDGETNSNDEFLSGNKFIWFLTIILGLASFIAMMLFEYSQYVFQGIALLGITRITYTSLRIGKSETNKTIVILKEKLKTDKVELSEKIMYLKENALALKKKNIEFLELTNGLTLEMNELKSQWSKERKKLLESIGEIEESLAKQEVAILSLQGNVNDVDGRIAEKIAIIETKYSNDISELNTSLKDLKTSIEELKGMVIKPSLEENKKDQKVNSKIPKRVDYTDPALQAALFK